MVTVVKGDLLDATEKVIAHQVNCQRKMNSGVAKAIREKWSVVFEQYIDVEPQLGMTDFIYDPIFIKSTDGHIIANMYAQDNYGYDGKQYTNYEAFRECCKRIVDKCRIAKRYEHISYSVAMPYKIGSDRGGADWDKIMDILLEVFTDVDLTLYKL
jgi:O-acetyl-ADP-ribose deacetylase (regulator of RNase III)